MVPRPSSAKLATPAEPDLLTVVELACYLGLSRGSRCFVVFAGNNRTDRLRESDGPLCPIICAPGWRGASVMTRLPVGANLSTSTFASWQPSLSRPPRLSGRRMRGQTGDSPARRRAGPARWAGQGRSGAMAASKTRDRNQMAFADSLPFPGRVELLVAYCRWFPAADIARCGGRRRRLVDEAGESARRAADVSPEQTASAPSIVQPPVNTDRRRKTARS